MVMLIAVTGVHALEITDAVFQGNPGIETTTITITNDEAYPLKDIVISDTLDSTYNLSIEAPPATLQTGSSVDLTVTAVIPSNVGSVMQTVGTITVDAELNIPDTQSPYEFDMMFEFGDFNLDIIDTDLQDPFERLVEQMNETEGQNDDAPSVCDTLQDELDALDWQFEQAMAAEGTFFTVADIEAMLNYEDARQDILDRMAAEGCDLPGDGDDGDDGNDGGNDDNDGGGDNAGSTHVSATGDVRMGRESMLVIDRVKINCGDLETVTEGETVDDVLPDSTCEVIIEVENRHPDSSDIYFDEVKVEVDGDRYVDDADRDIVLDAGEEQTVTLEVSVDEDADGREPMTVRVSGEDSEGDFFEDELSFELNIEPASNSVEIMTVSALPEDALRCEVDDVQVVARVENTGQHRERNAAVEFEVPSLGFSEKITGVDLDEGEDTLVDVSIPINKQTPFGSFVVHVRSFYDFVAQSDQATAEFTVMKCEDDVTVTVPPKKDNLVVVQPEQRQDPVEAEPVQETSNLYTMLLLLGNVLVLGLLGILGVGIARNLRPRKPEF